MHGCFLNNLLCLKAAFCAALDEKMPDLFMQFVQVILKQLDLIEDQTTAKTLHKKMAPPLVTLLSAESEIQYVALRNINLIVQKNPGILAHEVKVCYTETNAL